MPAAQALAAPDKGSNTGLPLPRWEALRTEEVNLRTGPGKRYPIEWVYKRRDLPVLVSREFDVWRLSEMPDGTKGWISGGTLVAHRTFTTRAVGTGHAAAAPASASGTTDALVPGQDGALPSGSAATAAESQPMRASASDDAAAVARLAPGVIGRIRSCQAGSAWCQVQVGDVRGWLRRDQFWGTSPGEAVP